MHCLLFCQRHQISDGMACASWHTAEKPGVCRSTHHTHTTNCPIAKGAEEILMARFRSGSGGIFTKEFIMFINDDESRHIQTSIKPSFKFVKQLTLKNNALFFLFVSQFR